MGKRIVLFNDLPGYGKVALAAMVPLFSRMGHFPYSGHDGLHAGYDKSVG